MGQDKFSLFPTRMNYKIIENKLKGAMNGYNLLSTKRDALKSHFRKLEEEKNRVNENVNELFYKAFMTLSKAEFYGANSKILKKKCKEKNIEIETKIEYICGLMIPKFKIINSNFEIEDMLFKGGSILMNAKDQFDKLLSLLVEISSLQNSYDVMKEMLDFTSRRANALEFMLIPKLENTLSFIRNELDEQERENFYKLKKIQKLKKPNSY